MRRLWRRVGNFRNIRRVPRGEFIVMRSLPQPASLHITVCQAALFGIWIRVAKGRWSLANSESRIHGPNVVANDRGQGMCCTTARVSRARYPTRLARGTCRPPFDPPGSRGLSRPRGRPHDSPPFLSKRGDHDRRSRKRELMPVRQKGLAPLDSRVRAFRRPDNHDQPSAGLDAASACVALDPR